MRIEELCIGDWVRRRKPASGEPHDTTPLRVLCPDIATNDLEPTVTLYNPVTRKNVAILAGDLEPIPLTEEFMDALKIFSTDKNDHTLTGAGRYRLWIEEKSMEIKVRPRNGWLKITVFDDHWFTLLETECCNTVGRFQHYLRDVGLKGSINAQMFLGPEQHEPNR